MVGEAGGSLTSAPETVAPNLCLSTGAQPDVGSILFN